VVAVDILQDDGQVGTSRGDESKMRGPYEDRRRKPTGF